MSNKARIIGRTDAEAETPILWPPHPKSWLIGEDSDAGRDWGQEEKGTIENEMAGWHHRIYGPKSEWTLGVGDGQGGLACCNLWGRKESDKTEWLNWTELNPVHVSCLSLKIHLVSYPCFLQLLCVCIHHIYTRARMMLWISWVICFFQYPGTSHK